MPATTRRCNTTQSSAWELCLRAWDPTGQKITAVLMEDNGSCRALAIRQEGNLRIDELEEEVSIAFRK